VIHAIKDIFDAIDTPGGHIVTCLGIGCAGVGVAVAGYTEIAKELLIFLPIAAYAMRGREKANGKDKPKEG
jgi:hypothetical protein